jgi:hypothetical protein
MDIVIIIQVAGEPIWDGRDDGATNYRFCGAQGVKRDVYGDGTAFH